MWNWFRRKHPVELVPLTGAPANPRVKTCSAASGIVYQYFYEGKRVLESGTEYVFAVSSDRKNYFDATVVLRRSIVEEWGRRHRPLADNEQYAVAKTALKNAFDESSNPQALRHIEPDSVLFGTFCESLDLP